jgi:DNA-binding beta-propeller fold protein YncE
MHSPTPSGTHRIAGLTAALATATLLSSGCSGSETPSATAADASPGGSALVEVYTEELAQGREVPRFQVDAGWPDLPDDLILGQVSGLAVDPEGDVWILNRPNSLGGTDIGAAQDPPIAVCCAPPPHIMQFSGATGEYLSGWGGPDHAPEVDGMNQWPANVHGLFVDAEGTVWIGGNGDGDHVVLRFTPEGEFLQQYGRRGDTGGNMDPGTLGNPADVFHDTETGEVVVADGYINKRILAFDAESGDFVRFWGAYGTAPDAPTREGAFDQSQATSTADGGADPESESFGDIVHCVTRHPDGRYFVCDRRNNRIQIFRPTEDGEVEFVENLVIAPETGGTRTASDVAFSPDGEFMYVADMMNGRVWILDADGYEMLGAFGRNGRYPGEFIWLHSVETDADGNVYTTEVSTGRRVQKFVLTNGVGVTE